jgi:guanine deaminase
LPWKARIPRLAFGATSHDVAVRGFEDLQLYRELTRDARNRTLQEDAADEVQRHSATAVLAA